MYIKVHSEDIVLISGIVRYLANLFVVDVQDITDIALGYLRTHFLMDGLFKMLCIHDSSNFASTV